MTNPSPVGRPGIALIAVLVALSIMLAVLGPFLLSMSQVDQHANDQINTAEAKQTVEGARDVALNRVARTQGTHDPTPGVDGEDEFDKTFSLGPKQGDPLLAVRRIASGEVEDLQGRLHAPTLPQVVWGNLLGLETILTEDLKNDEENLIPAGDTSKFADDGWIWINHELIRYEKKTSRGFENLTRHVGWGGGPPDPYGGPGKHTKGTMIFDARVRLLVTSQFDDGHQDRSRFRPWGSLEELPAITRFERGELTMEDLEPLRQLLTFDAARPAGSALGKAERVMNELLPGQSLTLEVKDGTSFPTGTVVRIKTEEATEWALVVGHRARGGRTSTIDGSRWFLHLHRVTAIAAEEGTAVVQPLHPVPVNINTASDRALAAILEGARQNADASSRRGHRVMRVPLSRTKARQLAERFVASRAALDEDDEPRPLATFEDVVNRAVRPMLEEGVLTMTELQYVFSILVNGLDKKLDQASVPIVFESSGLVKYRIAAAVQSNAGTTLAQREIRGIGLPQPARAVDRIIASQLDFDEASRADRSRPHWTTWPLNTSMRFAPATTEPPDLSVPSLLPFFHGQAARWPTKDPEAGAASLAIAPAPSWRAARPVNFGFAAEEHPEGYDATKRGPYKDIKATLPGGTGRDARRAMEGMVRSGGIPMVTGEQGFGIAFGFSAWFKPEAIGNQMLFELGNRASTPVQNRIFLAMEDSQLVLRIFDAAGLDPAPDVFNPEETCTKWTVELSGNGIEPDLWTHVGFEICGGTADGLVLFTDGAPKGKPWFVTSLGVEIPEYEPTSLDPKLREDARHEPIAVESTEGWPKVGVAVVGGELFEYTDIVDGGLILARQDSRGGRFARQGGLEYRQGNNADAPIKVPSHPVKSGIKLYGYSNPLLEDYVVIPSEGTLADQLGPWGIAKVVGGKRPIELAGRFPVGKGIDEKFTGQIDLAMPVPNSKAGGDGIPGFDKNGGYALLMQVHWSIDEPQPDQLGGVEVIRYSGFNGGQLSIEERAIALPPDLNADNSRDGWIAPKNEPRKFVTEWDRIFPRQDANELPQMFLYCVPISVAVSGLSLIDPSDKGHSEWIQIKPSDESLTEWVRYDYVDTGRGWVVRTRKRAIYDLWWHITQRGRRGDPQVVRQGNNYRITWPALPGPTNFVQPPQNIAKDEIGAPDQFEVGDNLPHYDARLRLRFRGDPGTATSTHTHGGDAIVTPVFRTVLREGNVTLGRPGRSDRVALLTGASGDSPPIVDWHTVNWSVRNWEIFNTNNSGNQGGGSGGGGRRGGGGSGGGNRQGMARDSRGPRCNLVALKAGVKAPYSGAKLVEDTRLLDRLVKFPSGELPIQLAEPVVGGSETNDLPPFKGLIDDIQGYWGFHHNGASGGANDEILGVVRVPCTDSDLVMTLGTGRRGRGGLGRLQGGGLALIEGEIVGFTKYDAGTGRLEIATNGRGMLGTEPIAHDRGARVQFLSSKPATYLTGGIPATAAGFIVARPENLPTEAGTVLCGAELMHYTWRRGPLFEMPPHAIANQGLFRGRYGTTPAKHDGNEMVIAWPIRYWDRYDDRADDPELSYLGFSTEAPNLFVTEIGWEEEIPEGTMDIVFQARADERVPWSADPENTFGLWTFDDPKDDDGKLGRKISAQASRWDFRFCVKYLVGAFNPELFNGTGWKRTPRIKSFIYSYESATSILQEEVSLR